VRLVGGRGRPGTTRPVAGPGSPGAGAAAPRGVRTVPAGGAAAATRIVLVRHGQSACAVAGVVGGILGCSGLTPDGVQQAHALARRLGETGELAGASALYSSVLARAVETAAVIAPYVGDGTLPCVTDCGLCELHPGEADGLSWSEFARRYGEPDWDADPTTVIAPGGESWTGFVARASASVAALAQRHAGQTVVVACHAGVVEATMLAFLPVTARRLHLPTEHTSLTEWEHDGQHWRLRRYNDAAHLVGSLRSGEAPRSGQQA